MEEEEDQESEGHDGADRHRELNSQTEQAQPSTSVEKQKQRTVPIQQFLIDLQVGHRLHVVKCVWEAGEKMLE